MSRIQFLLVATASEKRALLAVTDGHPPACSHTLVLMYRVATGYNYFIMIFCEFLEVQTNLEV